MRVLGLGLCAVDSRTASGDGPRGGEAVAGDDVLVRGAPAAAFCNMDNKLAPSPTLHEHVNKKETETERQRGRKTYQDSETVGGKETEGVVTTVSKGHTRQRNL